MQWLTKSDLIVVLDFFSNQDTINEAYLVKIPIIALNCELDILNAVFTYKIPGNFKFTNKKVGDIFFYSLLSATFKKAQKSFLTKKENVK